MILDVGSDVASGTDKCILSEDIDHDALKQHVQVKESVVHVGVTCMKLCFK